jgi:3-deoxy-7-phosphoheptulonate synthase
MVVVMAAAAQRLSHLPVVVDPSHSGGRRDLVLPLSPAAIAVGADGIIVDVHPHPESSRREISAA